MKIHNFLRCPPTASVMMFSLAGHVGNATSGGGRLGSTRDSRLRITPVTVTTVGSTTSFAACARDGRIRATAAADDNGEEEVAGSGAAFPTRGDDGSGGGEAWRPSPTWIQRRPPSPHMAAAADLKVVRHGSRRPRGSDGDCPPLTRRRRI
uniref:Uncharacterized protein n=1 Tax=Oryza glumipatula TaxID=40148 RepID=A0A0D9ZY09_9ORYZ